MATRTVVIFQRYLKGEKKRKKSGFQVKPKHSVSMFFPALLRNWNAALHQKEKLKLCASIIFAIRILRVSF